MIKAAKQSAEATITTIANDMLYRSKLRVKANCNNNCNSKEIIPPTTTATTLENNFEISSNNDAQQQSPPLKKLSLRGNQLCGSILIGNYNYLTQLEVCENEMEVLDLSSLAQLETIKCSYNKLMDLILNGSSLQTLIANHNNLHSVTVNPVPLKLSSIDISYNQFSELPNWIGACVLLQRVLAHHNHLTDAKSLFSAYRIGTLRVLNLAQNCLQTLDRLPEACASLKEVYLQSNELQCLPENFFAVTQNKLHVLNVSCNRLLKLPLYVADNNCVLEELFISGNQLNDCVFDTLIHAHKLRTLYAAYNRITELPEACIRNWCELEELVLAGNMLQQLPENIETLNKLKVLRVHSNLLLSTPTLSKLSQLKVLDLAHNHLDRINLLSLVPKNLKYLDLSANLQLSVDEQQLKVCQTQSQKHWSLIDVSGKNRDALPTTHKLGTIKDGGGGSGNSLKPPWLLGFAETPGNCRKLLVSQLRQPVYHTDEGLFGMFECYQTSSVCSGAANSLAVLVPHILQEQALAKNAMTNCDCLKYTLIKAQQRLPGCITAAAICHVAKEQTRPKTYVRPLRTKRFVMRVVSIGPIGAYLVRRTSNFCLTQQPNAQSGRLAERTRWQAKRQQLEPEIVEITLSNDDEYFVLGNAHLFSVLDIERIAREIRKAENALLAAKRIQDIAQSFGASENLSVIVVRFRNIGTDVEHLIKELKQSVRKKATNGSVTACLAQPVPQSSNMCKRTCCYRSDACRQRSLECNANITRSERSSPSGQSDQLHKELCGGGAVANDEFILAHARVLEEEEQQMEMLDETDSVLSEEQFKCWEYMLEQNTQLLFDKELNTISKSFTKNRNNEQKIHVSNVDGLDFKTNLRKGVANKFMSNSSPQLLYTEKIKTKPPVSTVHQQIQQPLPQLSFLSKHFGSSRSVQQGTGYNLFESKSRDSLAANPVTKLSGGPNAAYFGSLQRLMPYNLEYDFAVTQERNTLDEENDNDNNDDDYLEHESRMRKYWGVATTEL